jgi:hypothetical protein
MNAHALTYPALRRRLVAQRRARALFLGPTTQHVETRAIVREVGRAAMALAAASAWCVVVALLAA